MSAPKLYCDEMLKGLGRWLRAAGYDTRIAADGAPDRDLLAAARREGRRLLTRDAALLAHRGAADAVVLLHCNRIDECALEAARRLPIDWLYRPFSRCLLCNTALVPPPAGQWERIPPRARQRVQSRADVSYCPSCDKVYWSGTHSRRMRAILARWRARVAARTRRPEG